jgi:hypothetical protein
MLKKIVWKEDTVLNVKLRSDLFTLAQMRPNSLMQFFDIRSKDGIWDGIDLTNVPTLFCIYVAENRLKSLFVELVPVEKVMPNHRPVPTKMIAYRFGANENHEADLVELTEDYSNIGARVIKTALTIEKDLDVIYTHEYVGMFGDPEKLRKRLVRFFDTGVNWDASKAFIFKGIQPPPAIINS